MRQLTAVEARVLGVLVEKQATVPDTYPLSLNALTAGCNQKTARDPVMAVSDADALQALDALRAANLVVESSGSRVSRYEHNLPRAWALPGASVALLAVLMLRGPQTAAELRANCERLHRFAFAQFGETFANRRRCHRLKPKPLNRFIAFGMLDDVAENEFAFAPGVASIDKRINILAFDEFE